FELLDRPTATFAFECQGPSETVRIEISEVGRSKGLAKDPPNRRRSAPVLTHQAAGLEQAGAFSELDPSRREQRIVGAPGIVCAELVHPIGEDLFEDVADREEERRDRLAEFRPHLPRILVNAASV